MNKKYGYNNMTQSAKTNALMDDGDEKLNRISHQASSMLRSQSNSASQRSIMGSSAADPKDMMKMLTQSHTA